MSVVPITKQEFEAVLENLGYQKFDDSCLLMFCKTFAGGELRLDVILPKADLIRFSISQLKGNGVSFLPIKRVQRTKGWQSRLAERIRCLEEFLVSFPWCVEHRELMLPQSAHKEPLRAILFTCSTTASSRCGALEYAFGYQYPLMRQHVSRSRQK